MVIRFGKTHKIAVTGALLLFVGLALAGCTEEEKSRLAVIDTCLEKDVNSVLQLQCMDLAVPRCLDQLLDLLPLGGNDKDLDQDGIADALEVALQHDWGYGEVGLYDPCKSSSDGDSIPDGADLVQCLGDGCSSGLGLQLVLTAYYNVEANDAGVNIPVPGGKVPGDVMDDFTWHEGDPFIAAGSYVGVGNFVPGIGPHSGSQLGAYVQFDGFQHGDADGANEDRAWRTGLRSGLIDAPLSSGRLQNGKIPLPENVLDWLSAPADEDAQKRLGLSSFAGPTITGALVVLDQDGGCDMEIYAPGEPEGEYCPGDVMLVPNTGTGDTLMLMFGLYGAIGSTVQDATSMRGGLAEGTLWGDQEAKICAPQYGIVLCFDVQLTDMSGAPIQDWCAVNIARDRWIANLRGDILRDRPTELPCNGRFSRYA